eukprot:TRINITY_DN25386_c0_g1_i2.p2 TRINITY_DN25386_c0_g1~~TRINITY_DN25386_c0_g1_i2.p2  ORF type:complete len:282 (+),score=80.98 TRINITY_DN25386_c0_g1_i2:335-1180(+)
MVSRGTLSSIADVTAAPKHVAVFCVILITRTLTNVASANWGDPSVLQLVNLLAPFLTSSFSRLLLPVGDAPPLEGWDVAAMVTTTAAAVVALLPSLLHPDHGTRNVIGGVMQLVSTCCLALYLVATRKAKGRFTPDCQIALQFACALSSAALFSAALREGWGKWLRHLDWPGALAWAAFGLGPNFAGNHLQVAGVRAIGPAVWTLPLPSRLAVAIAGGRLLLGERTHSPLQWIGAGLVMALLFAHLGRIALYERRRHERGSRLADEPPAAELRPVSPEQSA